jgi:hypothetical protein
LTININVLWAVNSAEKIFDMGIQVAQALGLPTTSWRTGDPERSLYKYLAEVLAAHDGQVSSYIKAGFLSSAVADANETGETGWLKLLAYETFGVTVPDAGYATPSVTLRNEGGGNYPRLAGEITVKNSATGKTYHNTNAPAPLNAGATVTYTLEADEAGAESSAAVNEIDEIVTTMLGVVVVSSSASYASDELTPDEIGTLCSATLGALSPNGPPDAFEYVCLNPELTGTTEVTRAYSYGTSSSGRVQVYVASATGSVSVGGLQACQDAVEEWATPLCALPTVLSAVPYAVAVTCTIAGVAIPADFAERIEGEIETYFASLPIHGTVARSAILAAIHRAVPAVDIATLITPAADVALGVAEVATLGTVTVTEI